MGAGEEKGRRTGGRKEAEEKVGKIVRFPCNITYKQKIHTKGNVPKGTYTVKIYVTE